jgi:hypothetical protein
MKYRKKPVVIEAIQFVGNNAVEIHLFTGTSYPTKESMMHHDWKRKQLVIPTLEGDMIASYGDWIIKGVKGEFYPCKPDIFEATYEPEDGAEAPAHPQHNVQDHQSQPK